MRIQLYNSEQGRHNQNHAVEREIGFLANRWRRQMKKTVIPRLLCNFGLVYKSELLSRMSIVKGKRSGYEEVTCQTLEIGDYLDFEFYNLFWWKD